MEPKCSDVSPCRNKPGTGCLDGYDVPTVAKWALDNSDCSAFRGKTGESPYGSANKAEGMWLERTPPRVCLSLFGMAGYPEKGLERHGKIITSVCPFVQPCFSSQLFLKAASRLKFVVGHKHCNCMTSFEWLGCT